MSANRRYVRNKSFTVRWISVCISEHIYLLGFYLKILIDEFVFVIVLTTSGQLLHERHYFDNIIPSNNTSAEIQSIFPRQIIE